MAEKNHYDIIIIGSGMGALATASIMAQLENKRVLLLERHFQEGGYTHAFKRKRKYSWDVGLHYVGQLAKGQPVRKAFDLITKGRLKWNKMPSPYEKFIYPDITFEVRDGEENYRADLIKAFPNEEKAIRQYFKDINECQAWFRKNEIKKNLPGILDKMRFIIPNSSRFAEMTVKEYLDASFNDEKLKAIVISQWGDYGLPPEKASFPMHCVLTSHYFTGGYYPIGGSSKIAEYTVDLIKEKGGDILLNHQVNEIIVKNGKATGVKATYLRDTTGDANREFSAEIIISNAGAYNTFLKLLPGSVPLPWRKELREFDEQNPQTAHIDLYLGLKESPEKLGFKGENHWTFSGYDHSAAYSSRNDWIKKGKPEMLYFSFASLKDPEAEHHTAEIITFTDYENFAKWKDEPWKKRGDEYSAWKEKIAQGILERAEELYPGFKNLVDYYELSTPLSTETMTGHHRATIYGLAGVPARFNLEKSPWAQPRTPVKNLYLTGTEASAWGIAGAAIGGILTTIHLLKPWNLPRVLTKL